MPFQQTLFPLQQGLIGKAPQGPAQQNRRQNRAQEPYPQQHPGADQHQPAKGKPLRYRKKLPAQPVPLWPEAWTQTQPQAQF